MLLLKEALPFLVLDLEAALAHLGRGKISEQLRQVIIERWTYDEHADAGYVYLRSPKAPVGAQPVGETVSVFDELGINLETDSQGHLIGMEIQGAHAIMAQLEQQATSPQSP